MYYMRQACFGMLLSLMGLYLFGIWKMHRILGMFYAQSFDQPNLNPNRGMFYGAQSFDQELCWNVSNAYTTDMMFYNSSGCIRPRCCAGCDEDLLCIDSDDDDLFEEQ